jgi:hypothetical protein
MYKTTKDRIKFFADSLIGDMSPANYDGNYCPVCRSSRMTMVDTPEWSRKKKEYYCKLECTDCCSQWIEILVIGTLGKINYGSVYKRIVNNRGFEEEGEEDA